MNNFFDETTSNYSDVKEDSPEKSVAKKDTTPKKSTKPVKQHSNCLVSERFLYHPDLELIDLSPFISQYVQFTVEKKFLSKKNKNVKKNKVFGTDDYTSNSDVVCVLLHMGWINLKELKKKRFEAIEAVFQVKKIKKNYVGSERNEVASKKFNQPVSKIQNLKPISVRYS